MSSIAPTFQDNLLGMAHAMMSECQDFIPNCLAVYAATEAILLTRQECYPADGGPVELFQHEIDTLITASVTPLECTSFDAIVAAPDVAPPTPAPATPAPAPVTPSKGKGRGKAAEPKAKATPKVSPNKEAAVGKSKRPYVPRTQVFERVAIACNACRIRKCKCESVPVGFGCVHCAKNGICCEKEPEESRNYGSQAKVKEEMALRGEVYQLSRGRRITKSRTSSADSSSTDASSETTPSSPPAAGPSGTTWSDDEEEGQSQDAAEYPDLLVALGYNPDGSKVEQPASPAVDSASDVEASVSTAANLTPVVDTTQLLNKDALYFDAFNGGEQVEGTSWEEMEKVWATFAPNATQFDMSFVNPAELKV
ncbi:hypothetical protein IAT38_005252 [Cryptococcus sp. DSM 104549]